MVCFVNVLAFVMEIFLKDGLQRFVVQLNCSNAHWSNVHTQTLLPNTLSLFKHIVAPFVMMLLRHMQQAVRVAAKLLLGHTSEASHWMVTFSLTSWYMFFKTGSVLTSCFTALKASFCCDLEYHKVSLTISRRRGSHVSDRCGKYLLGKVGHKSNTFYIVKSLYFQNSFHLK